MSLKLVFIHGWGFNKNFFDLLAPLLSPYQQIHIDLGFFDIGLDPFSNAIMDLGHSTDGHILIGHSLGFAAAIKARGDWQGWVAINGFCRFTKTKEDDGCVRKSALLEMQKRLERDANACLNQFYEQCGYLYAPPEGCNQQRLQEGLIELATIDIETTLAGSQKRGLVLAAEKDWLVPASHSQRLAKHASDHLVLHPEAGHLLPQTEPAWCARQIDDFVTRSFI